MGDKKLKKYLRRMHILLSLYRFCKYKFIAFKKPVYRKELGFKFSGTHQMDIGVFEPEESEFFDYIIKHSDYFINVGANFGYYVCKALNENTTTIAIEASPQNTKVLLSNVHANDFQASFSMFQLAISDRRGILKLYGNGTSASLIDGWAEQSSYQLVPVNTLDVISYKKDRCLIWMDIEGAELSALKGATQLLHAEQNIWVLEVNITEHQPNGLAINPNLIETFQIFESHGYHAYCLSKPLRSVSIKEISLIVKTRIDTLSVHNFVFVKDINLLNGSPLNIERID